jgi:superfamily II DNA helicase RecQ
LRPFEGGAIRSAMENERLLPLATIAADGDLRPRSLLRALERWSDELQAATVRLRSELLRMAVLEGPPDKDRALSPEARRERLRRWRREEARRRGVAPYLVLTNGVVERLATMEVLGREDLRRIPGIGPRKLEVYGEAILKVLGG